MNAVPQSIDVETAPDWPRAIFDVLRQAGVTQAAYVPDAGHSRLIELLHGDAAVRAAVDFAKALSRATSA